MSRMRASIEKMVRPPMNGPTRILPGHITYMVPPDILGYVLAAGVTRNELLDDLPMVPVEDEGDA